MLSDARKAFDTQKGKSYPIAEGSNEKSRSVYAKANASGQSAWHLLECGIKVCVRYKDSKPILWVGKRSDFSTDHLETV